VFVSVYLYYYLFHKLFGDGNGRLICGWLGVVCAWSTHATVGSGRGWLGVVVARQAHLSGWLGATGQCASTGGGVLVYTMSGKQIHTLNKAGSHIPYSQQIAMRET